MGTTFRTRDLDAYRAIADGAAGTLLPLIVSGQVIPPAINRVFPLDQADDAIDHALTQHLPGKVVVDVDLRSRTPGVLPGQLLANLKRRHARRRAGSPPRECRRLQANASGQQPFTSRRVTSRGRRPAPVRAVSADLAQVCARRPP
jgi:hypothetical protein